MLPVLTSCVQITTNPNTDSVVEPATDSTATSTNGSPSPSGAAAPKPEAVKQQLDPSLPTEPSPQLLTESWNAYRDRFIQADGRVIDWEAESRSTSESQAYAMLRAVLADDPDTFTRTLQWAEDNLARPSSSQPDAPLSDRLWSWNWGKRGDRWVVLDPNFATDGDIDAVTALIFAHRRWNKPEYLTLAKLKLKDIWELSTIQLGDQRYLLPGPKAAFVKPDGVEAKVKVENETESDLEVNPAIDTQVDNSSQTGDRLQLNPSYFAPYAFRIFASVDPERDWLSLVESSYRVLEGSSELSAQGLPSDWIEVNPDGTFQPITPPSRLSSRYSFDAYRVWWRISLDAMWFDAPEAHQYLTQHLSSFRQVWRQEQRILAQYDLKGEPLADYEATSQYGMLYPGFRLTNPKIAAELFQFKLLPRYNDGLWDDESAYYSQNLAWLGLFPFETFSETAR